MNKHFLTLSALSLFATTAFSDVVTISSKSNIFKAGHPNAVNDVSNGGLLPPTIALPPGINRVMTITNASGLLNWQGGTPSTGPDGAGSYGAVSSSGGISGYQNGHFMALLGVFLTDAESADPAPAVINYATIGYNFTTISPVVAQTFYVGDGLTGTGSGTLQSFHIPNSATRVFFGFADAIGGSGTANAYGDNVGNEQITVTISAPNLVPASIALYPGISFDAVIGNSYSIEATSDLTDPSSWQSIVTVVATEIHPIYYDRSGPTLNRRFYRVRAQ